MVLVRRISTKTCLYVRARDCRDFIGMRGAEARAAMEAAGWKFGTYYFDGAHFLGYRLTIKAVKP